MSHLQHNITVLDVARAVGVSKSTAAAAMNDLDQSALRGKRALATRQRVRDAAARMGYRRSALATALSVGRIYTVGLVTQVNPNARTEDINWYQKDVMIAVSCACARAGLRMTTILVKGAGAVSAADIVDGRIDGAIMTTLGDEILAKSLFAQKFPAVTIGSGYSERRIGLDNAGGVAAAISHLVELGHRRIVYVDSRDTGLFTARERAAGYRAAMAARGLPARILNAGNLNEIFAGMPNADRPTACVCFNDGCAVDAVRWARGAGLAVPEAFSVVGFDNGVAARLADPPLTSVENPIDAQADAAIALLQVIWRGEDCPSPLPLPTRLIIRDSTAVVAACHHPKEL
jgi:DNA-binding LacI/PurR family transcriptional regulator